MESGGDAARFLDGRDGHATWNGRLATHPSRIPATLPTKLGGGVDFVARMMAFEFPNSVDVVESYLALGSSGSSDVQVR